MNKSENIAPVQQASREAFVGSRPDLEPNVIIAALFQSETMAAREDIFVLHGTLGLLAFILAFQPLQQIGKGGIG